MRKPEKTSNIVLFLMGLFSMTQIRVIGAIGISEVPIYIVAPFIFLADYQKLRQDGFLPIIWLSLLTCVGDCISSWLNQTYIEQAIKGFATPYSIFSVIVVLHRVLRNNLSGYKCLLVGIAFSLILNIFIFQQSAELSAFSEGAVGLEAGRRIVGTSSIFWTSRIRPFIDALIGGWYTQVPVSFSAFIMLAFFVFSAITTASGRSMALATIGGVIILLLGGKKRKRMQFFKRNFGVFVVGCIFAAFVLGGSYKFAAQSGWMGEKAREKYESQMKDRKNVWGILQGGRGEVFIGLTACIDKPLWGHGPWPLDKNDYVKRYLEKYGTVAEWDAYFSHERYLSLIGMTHYHLIPGHSHLISFWLSYGIVGFLLWVYVLYLIVNYFRRYVDAVPQWFGYMAITLPLFVWNIFFSPYGYRISTPLTICLLLFSRAIAKGRLNPSWEMVQEATRYD